MTYAELFCMSAIVIVDASPLLLCVFCLSHFAGHLNSLKHPQTIFTTETSRVLRTSCNVWQTASKSDVLVVHSGTILMCHLISNHTVLLQKGKRRGASARIGRYGRYSGRMEIGEGVERVEVGWGGGGCRGKEISVSAKVFIKILRQMISVSFSWSCLGRHAISMQITTSRLCSYYFCWSCCNMTQERRGGRREYRGRRERGEWVRVIWSEKEK